MNSVPELIRKVTAAGGRFVIEGDRLGIVPRDIAVPLIEELRRHKQAIIDLLQNSHDRLLVERPNFVARNASSGEKIPDPDQMPALPATMPVLPGGVKLIRYVPKAAPVEMPTGSTVTNVERFTVSTIEQLRALLSGEKWRSGNWGLSGLLERLAAVGCYLALDDPKRALQ